MVSNKHAPGVKALCAHYFDGLLDVAVGGDGTRPLKPAPDNLLYAMEQMGVAPEAVWYVGDSVQDVITAHAAGVKVAAVTWGFQDAERLAAEHPTALASDAAALKRVILGEE